MKIEVFTERASSRCDTCGANYDEGGYALVDGKEVFRYTPQASCWGNAMYDESDLIILALREIGIDIKVDGELPYSWVKYNGDENES